MEIFWILPDLIQYFKQVKSAFLDTCTRGNIFVDVSSPSLFKCIRNIISCYLCKQM